MAINVVQPKTGTISGVVPATPQARIGGVVQPPAMPSLSVTSNPMMSGNFNPQTAGQGGMIQKAPAAPVQQGSMNGGQIAQPAAGAPAANQSFGFMDGSSYNAQGQQQTAPQFTPEQIGTAMHVALNSPPPSSGTPAQQPPPQQDPTPPAAPPTPSNLYPPGYDPTAMKGLEANVQQYSQLSPAEIQAQQELNTLTASEGFGLNKIKQDPNLVMPLLVGQQQALRDQATAAAVPLQQQAALAQAKRQASLDASKFALDREDTRLGYLKTIEAPQTVAPGATTGRLNAGTGQFTPSYTAPYAPIANPLSPSGITTFGNGNTGSTSQSTFGSPSSSGSFSMGSAPGSAAAVNNPLGIKPGGKFAQYQTPEQGLQAGVDLIKKYQTAGPAGMNANSSLNQMVNTWITGNPNNTNKTGYNATNVAQYLQQLGVNANANTPIGQIDSQQLALAISHFETGYTPGQGSTAGSSPIQTYAQQVVSGAIPPSQVPGQYQAIVNQMATQLDAKYNPGQAEINYQNQQKAQTNAVPLVQAQQAAIQHLGDLTDLAKAVGFGDSPAYNKARAAYYENVQSNNDYSAYKSTLSLARGEVAKVLAGTGASSDDARAEAANIIPDYISPGNLKNTIANVQKAMQQKIQQYTQNYNPNSSNSSGSDPAGLRSLLMP